jgi:hypothetical protein
VTRRDPAITLFSEALERRLESTALDGESPAATLAGTAVETTDAALACRLPAGDLTSRRVAVAVIPAPLRTFRARALTRGDALANYDHREF